MGAGKSTMSQDIAKQTGAILLSEDEWLAAIYPDEIQNFDDYIKYSVRVKPLMKTHVQELLGSGVSVVMDFPGNTPEQRLWFKEIFSDQGFPHKLIYLNVGDELCLKQIGYRRESSPERKNFDTEEVFHQVTSYFRPPSDEEGFSIEVITRENA